METTSRRVWSSKQTEVSSMAVEVSRKIFFFFFLRENFTSIKIIKSKKKHKKHKKHIQVNK